MRQRSFWQCGGRKSAFDAPCLRFVYGKSEVNAPHSPPHEDASKQSPPQKQDDELLGRCLNETYIVESVLGEGGVGRVYRARHARIATKEYALKVLHAEHARDPQQLARFQREAEAAASLSHPNVVGVFDVGRTEDGYSYLACELLSGNDLDAYLEKHGRVSIQMAVHIGIQICEALESAHQRNIIHRDLKPQNVFLLSGPKGDIPQLGHIKLVDFGLSRMLDHTDSQLTKTGTLMGTPAFMAPEQATGQRGDHRVDIYGVGVILYASVTGRPPFLEETLPGMLLAVMTEEAVRPSKLVPEIPQALELTIQRAMAKQPDDRYRTVAALRDALLEVQETLGQTQKLGRPRMSSTLHNQNEASDLKTSRLRLVYFVFVAMLIVLSILAAAVSGLELITGPLHFSRTELTLILAGLIGTIATPAALLFKHFRRSIWANSAKVIDALSAVRAPLIAALLTYGTASIGLRFADEFLSRLGPNSLFAPYPGVAWPGFTWILPFAALMAAGFSYLILRVGRRDLSETKRGWLSGLLRVISVLAVLGVLWVGVVFRKMDVERRTLAAAAAAAAGRAAPASAVPVRRPEDPATLPQPREEPIALASDKELASALEAGIDGLLPLSERYPKDARVLEPLLVEFASRATGLADAMVTAKRLVAVDPEKRANETLGLMVRRAASSPGKASDLAFSLMKNELGSSGPDLLYALSKSGEKGADRAKQALLLEDVRKKMSPALRIAVELEEADSCEARLPLLHRAKYLGDLRASTILSPLAKGTKTGCGKWRNRPCPAHCQEQAKEYLDAVVAIQKRAATTSL